MGCFGTSIKPAAKKQRPCQRNLGGVMKRLLNNQETGENDNGKGLHASTSRRVRQTGGLGDDEFDFAVAAATAQALGQPSHWGQRGEEDEEDSQEAAAGLFSDDVDDMLLGKCSWSWEGLGRPCDSGLVMAGRDRAGSSGGGSGGRSGGGGGSSWGRKGARLGGGAGAGTGDGFGGSSSRGISRGKDKGKGKFVDEEEGGDGDEGGRGDGEGEEGGGGSGGEADREGEG
eukprot:jgi/Mesen1/4568/ME000232S03823